MAGERDLLAIELAAAERRITRLEANPEPLPLDVELRKLVANFIEDHDEGRLGNPDPIWCDGKCTGVRGLRAALSPDRPT